MPPTDSASGFHKIKTALFLDGERFKAGSVVRLREEDAARMVAQGTAEPCEAPPSASDVLGGLYKTKTWFSVPARDRGGDGPFGGGGIKRVPPGTMIRLSHEDAERAIAQGTVEKPQAPKSAEAAPADPKKPEPSTGTGTTSGGGTGGESTGGDGGAGKGSKDKK